MDTNQKLEESDLKILQESRLGTKILNMSWARYRENAMNRGKNVQSIVVSYLKFNVKLL